MYNVEVLSKFPVVQHFPFGSLFAWEKDPNAKIIQASVHTSSQPKSSSTSSATPTARPQPALRDVRANAPVGNNQATQAPWASSSAALPPAPSGPNQPTRAPWASSTPAPPSVERGTTAPWARIPGGQDTGNSRGGQQNIQEQTRAPWANRKP
jgi:serine/threonine-protein phosphatase 2A activator